jgi:choline dehydrogenase-like flavoprotein
MGLFNLDMAIHPNGQRASAYNTYLDKKLALNRRQRLTVCTGVVVSKLDVDEHAGLVRGVHFQSLGKDIGSTVYVRARREVIVCSGAICTPQILLLSGIGPRSQLEALEVPVKKDLPV